MGDAGQRLYPFLPVKLLLKHRFLSIEKIPAIKCPTILAHGRRDTLVPFSMCGELAKAAGGPVTQIPIEGPATTISGSPAPGRCFGSSTY